MPWRISLSIAGMILLSACASPPVLTSTSPEVGALAPEFTLKDLHGNDVSLSDFRGQIVLLNFWATWCGPCREEMPTIQERYNGGGFAILAINFGESQEKVQEYLDELGIDLPVLLDPGGSIQELYRVRGYPSSFFVDPDGVIRFIHIGELKQDDLDYYLSQLKG